MNIKEASKDAFRKKVGIAICIFLGLFFLYEHSVNPEITQENDLITLDVDIKDFTFERYEDDSRRYPTYYIKTLQYQNLFRVAADDIWLFNIAQFENDSLKNKTVQVKISNEEEAQLNRPDKIISLYEISTSSKSYLSSKETLRENQGPVHLMLSIGFLGMAGFLVVLLKKKL